MTISVAFVISYYLWLIIMLPVTNGDFHNRRCGVTYYISAICFNIYEATDWPLWHISFLSTQMEWLRKAPLSENTLQQVWKCGKIKVFFWPLK